MADLHRVGRDSLVLQHRNERKNRTHLASVVNVLSADVNAMRGMRNEIASKAVSPSAALGEIAIYSWVARDGRRQLHEERTTAKHHQDDAQRVRENPK